MSSDASAPQCLCGNKEARGTAGKAGVGPHVRDDCAGNPIQDQAALKTLRTFVRVLVTRRSQKGQ